MSSNVEPKNDLSQTQAPSTEPAELDEEQLADVAGGAKRKASGAAPAAPAPIM